jgi:hypothetical protein
MQRVPIYFIHGVVSAHEIMSNQPVFTSYCLPERSRRPMSQFKNQTDNIVSFPANFVRLIASCNTPPQIDKSTSKNELGKIGEDEASFSFARIILKPLSKFLSLFGCFFSNSDQNRASNEANSANKDKDKEKKKKEEEERRKREQEERKKGKTKGQTSPSLLPT